MKRQAVLLDTNILIDYLNGRKPARVCIEGNTCLISRITWMEVLAGGDPDEEERLREFLGSFEIVELSADTADEAVLIRRTHRLRLPDAIILATARVCQCRLLTRNTKDFKASWPEVVVPYRI